MEEHIARVSVLWTTQTMLQGATNSRKARLCAYIWFKGSRDTYAIYIYIYILER